jgi:hypothetical protein
MNTTVLIHFLKLPAVRNFPFLRIVLNLYVAFSRVFDVLCNQLRWQNRLDIVSAYLCRKTAYSFESFPPAVYWS